MTDLLIIDATRTEIRAGDGTGGLKLDPGATELITLSNGGIVFPDGTVDRPSIVFGNDGEFQDTGMYSSADENIDFTAGGIHVLNIDGVNKQVNLLGEMKLQVYSTSTFDGGATFNNLISSSVGIHDPSSGVLNLGGWFNGSTGLWEGQVYLQSDTIVNGALQVTSATIGGNSYPTTQGQSGYFLSTNGEGTLSWSAPPQGFSGSYTDLTNKPGVFSTSTSGFVPGPTAGDTGKYLRADGTWQTVSAGDPNWFLTNVSVAANTASTTDTFVFGYGNSATGSSTLNLLLGKSNSISGTNASGSVLIGSNWSSTTGKSIGIGVQSSTKSIPNASVVIGTNNPGSSGTQILIGHNSYGSSSIVIGNNAGKTSFTATGVYIGNSVQNNSQASGSSSSCVVIGYGAYTKANYGVALGDNTITSGLGVVVGSSSSTGGLNSVVVGYNSTTSTGTGNTVLGNNCTVTSSGANNTVIGYYSYAGSSSSNVVLGYSASTSGSAGNNVAVGEFAKCVTSGCTYNTIIGPSAEADGTSSNAITIGNSAKVSHKNAISIGFSSKTNFPGDISFSNGSVSFMKKTAIYQKVTTNATPTLMDTIFNDSTAKMTLPANATGTFTLLISARRASWESPLATSHWKIEGGFKKEATNSTTSVVGLSKNVIYQDDTTWDVNVIANTTNGTIDVEVTGIAGTIAWCGTMEMSYVVY